MTDLAPGSRMTEWLEQAWLERYLARQLSQAESDWFEAYILDKVGLLEQVEADTDLGDAFGAAATSDAPSPPRSATESQPNPDASTDFGRTRAHLTPSRRGGQDMHRDSRAARRRANLPSILAVGAMMMLALGLGWLARTELGARQPVLETSPTRIFFGSSRGSQSFVRVEGSGGKSDLVLVEAAVPVGISSVVIDIRGMPSRTERVPDSGTVTFVIDRGTAKAAGAVQLRYETDGRQEVLSLDLTTALEGPPK